MSGGTSGRGGRGGGGDHDGPPVMGPDELLALAQRVVDQARPGEEIEVACSFGQSRTIRVYQGEVESLTTADNTGIGVRVLAEGREGFASAGTLDDDVIADMLAEARDNAGFAEADPYVGIARPDGVAAVEVDLWRDGVAAMSPEAKIALAIELERRVRGADPAITGVRVAGYSDNEAAFALASTAGIGIATRASSASLSVQALAVDGDRTQTGYAYDGARDPALLDLDYVVQRAVRQTVDMIGAAKPATATVDLVLDPHLAATVLSLVAGTLTGDRVLKGRSPFVGRVGEQIAASALTVVDDATNLASLGADSHDGEGLATRRVPLIVDGVLQGFVHDSYTGRRSGLGSTGSAVRGVRGLPAPGLHALAVTPGSGSLEDLIARTDLGILVFSLAGLHSGVNPVSGDFSVGVEGRMIRQGQLAEPICECTIGATLQRLLLDISAVGGDLVHLPNSVSTPSLVISGVTMSGASA
jgi:PmbA protein